MLELVKYKSSSFKNDCAKYFKLFASMVSVEGDVKRIKEAFFDEEEVVNDDRLIGMSSCKRCKNEIS